jgi:hypothetical protein
VRQTQGDFSLLIPVACSGQLLNNVVSKLLGLNYPGIGAERKDPSLCVPPPFGKTCDPAGKITPAVHPFSPGRN